MEIVFLGTGGGRINLLRQLRATGGFRINSDAANIHVDPGPGALLHSIAQKQDVFKLDAIIVTHTHIDHVNDAGALLEAMSDHSTKKGGVLIGSKSVLAGVDRGLGLDRTISLYHQSKTSQNYIAIWGEKKTFRTKNGEFTMKIIKTQHEDETGFGFKLAIEGKTIGYTSDTEIFEGMGEAYKGCDFLILNCLKPENDRYGGHLTSIACAELLKTAKPKLAILTHMGMKMLDSPEKHAAMIEKESNVRCVAARDGQVLRLNNEKRNLSGLKSAGFEQGSGKESTEVDKK